MKRPHLQATGAVLAALLVTLPAATDIFYLKDGSKLTGTIVGFEDNAFRVETNFGIALIFKDRIERIVFTEKAQQAQTQAPVKSEESTPPESDVEPAKQPQPAEATAQPSKAPARFPRPTTIREEVEATRYINHTFHFQMFKPPTWRSYPKMVTPENTLVAALGTPEESTLLLIGWERYAGSLRDYVALADATLRRPYARYRMISERPVQVAGVPALERRFTGSAEGRFWWGMAVYFSRGQDHFTLLGVTADSETASFQQAVLRKVVKSLTFFESAATPAQSPGGR